MMMATMGKLDRQLYEAVIKGDVNQVRALLDKGAKPDPDPDPYCYGGRTPLLVACDLTSKPEGVAEALLDRGANVNCAREDGVTPLHWACHRGDAALVRLLLRHGADVKAKVGRHDELKKGATAAELALKAGYPVVAGLVAEGGAPEVDAKKILADVSRYWLRSEAVPSTLAKLWKATLGGDNVIGEGDFGEVSLVSAKEEDFFEGAYEDESYKAMFKQIAFIGREADGNYLGLWRYRRDVKLDAAPVVILWNEGNFEVSAPTLEEHFVWRAHSGCATDAAAAVKKLKAFYKRHGIGQPRALKDIEAARKALPNAQEAFDRLCRSYR